MLALKLFQKIFPLGYKSEFVILIKIAVPLVLSSLSQIFLTIISMFFCGHIGAAELDAASLANTLINIFALTAAYGLSSACDTLFPQLFGGESGGKKKIGLILQKSIVISIIGSLVTSALLLNMKYLITHVIEDKEVVRLTDEYITIFIPSIFFYNISTLLSKYIQSQNIVYPLMIINFLVILINSGLHALLIFYFELGLKGAAISVNISSFCLMLFIYLYIYFTKIYISTWPGWSRECLVEWKIYLRLALPGFLLLLIEWSNFEVATFISGNIGTTELGVMSITQQVLYIFYQLPFGLASAGNIHIGQLLGGNHSKRAKNATKVLASIAIMSMGILSMVLLAFSSYFPLLFSNDNEIIEKTGEVLKLVALVHILDASQGIGQGIIRSVGGQLYSSVVLFIGFYVFGLPIGICLLLLTPLRSFGYYIGVLCGGVVLVTLQFIYIFRINWEKSAEIAYKLSKPTDDELEETNKESLTNMSQFSLNIEEAEKTSKIRNKKRKMIFKMILIFFSMGVFAIGCITHELNHFGMNELNNLTNLTLNFTDSY